MTIHRASTGCVDFVVPLSHCVRWLHEVALAITNYEEFMPVRVLCSRLLAVTVFACAAVSASAQSMPASCQVEFQKQQAQREAAVQRINSFNKRRPTAQQACGAFNNLGGIENRMLKWMTENKEWCQLPDEIVKQMEQARAQTRKISGQVCTAARREAQGGGAASGANRAPPPGAGVRLPQGAL